MFSNIDTKSSIACDIFSATNEVMNPIIRDALRITRKVDLPKNKPYDEILKHNELSDTFVTKSSHLHVYDLITVHHTTDALFESPYREMLNQYYEKQLLKRIVRKAAMSYYSEYVETPHRMKLTSAVLDANVAERICLTALLLDVVTRSRHGDLDGRLANIRKLPNDTDLTAIVNKIVSLFTTRPDMLDSQQGYEDFKSNIYEMDEFIRYEKRIKEL